MDGQPENIMPSLLQLGVKTYKLAKHAENCHLHGSKLSVTSEISHAHNSQRTYQVNA